MNVKLIRRAAIVPLALGGLRTARRISGERADHRFMHIDPAQDTFHEVGAMRFRLPAAFRRTDGLVAYYAADLEQVRALLPSSLLHPVRTSWEHALVGVAAFRHMEIAGRDATGATLIFPPYGETCVFAAVTRRALPPLVPFLLEWAVDYPMGAFVLQLPVTSRLSRDIGRSIWGLPKFVADMEFVDEGGARSVHVSEAGRTILDLRVQLTGRVGTSRAPSIVYSVHDGRLIETRMESRMVIQQGLRPKGELRLGDHPVTQELLDIGLAERPFAGGSIVQQRFLMPSGRDLGMGSERPRHEGLDQEHGSFATRGADGMVIDHYALVAPSRPTTVSPLSVGVAGG